MENKIIIKPGFAEFHFVKFGEFPTIQSGDIVISSDQVIFQEEECHLVNMRLNSLFSIIQYVPLRYAEILESSL